MDRHFTYFHGHPFDPLAVNYIGERDLFLRIKKAVANKLDYEKKEKKRRSNAKPTGGETQEALAFLEGGPGDEDGSMNPDSLKGLDVEEQDGYLLHELQPFDPSRHLTNSKVYAPTANAANDSSQASFTMNQAVFPSGELSVDPLSGQLFLEGNIQILLSYYL